MRGQRPEGMCELLAIRQALFVRVKARIIRQLRVLQDFAEAPVLGLAAANHHIERSAQGKACDGSPPLPSLPRRWGTVPVAR